MRKQQTKMSVPGANDWVENACCPLPTALAVVVAANNQPSFRELQARLFTLAAEIARRSEGQAWVINVGHVSHAGGGRKNMSIGIELATDLDSEEEAATRMLQGLASEINRHMFLF